MQLILVRHAQTVANVQRALDTDDPGADLTTLGVQQVAELAQVLVDQQIDAVYASPRLRTRRTAKGLAEPRGLEPVVRAGLVEVSAGDWEMSTVPAEADAYNSVVLAWVAGDRSPRVPGGESYDDVLGRMDAVVSEVAGQGLGCAVVVAHGALLRAWTGVRVPNVPFELVRDHPLRNTGLIRLEGGPDGWLASEWDDQAVESDGPAGPVAD